MQHFYFNIPGWFNFQDVYDRAVALAPMDAVFVEVGCWKGRSTAYLTVDILNSTKNIVLDIVDTFAGSREHAEAGIDCSTLFDEFMHNIAPGLSAIRHIRCEPSLEAATRYEDGTLDFVFLDASHEREDVKADILAWLPKLGPDGVLAGDDLMAKLHPGVHEALMELGYFTEGNPGIVSGGVYRAWIIAPEHLADQWTTPRESI